MLGRLLASVKINIKHACLLVLFIVCSSMTAHPISVMSVGFVPQLGSRSSMGCDLILPTWHRTHKNGKSNICWCCKVICTYKCVCISLGWLHMELLAQAALVTFTSNFYFFFFVLLKKGKQIPLDNVACYCLYSDATVLSSHRHNLFHTDQEERKKCM